jgi:hypothetical protein
MNHRSSLPSPPTARSPVAAVVLTAALAVACAAAQAANFSKSSYDSARADIKATYKAERDNCGALAGNAKDICVEQAKGREAVALAQLEYNYTGKVADEQKLYAVRADTRYELAKERCDDLGGDAKDVCLRQARTEHEKAQAEIKLAKKVTSAIDEADQSRMKADYKLAIEKCGQLAGDAKDSCVSAAKSRYGEK